MTRANFTAIFKYASESVIQKNCEVITTNQKQQKLHCSKQLRSGRVSRTRNAGTWTEAQFWMAVRSSIRRTFRFWKPARVALLSARVPFHGPHGQKWAFICADCGKLFPRNQVEIDHIEPCGKLTDYSHLGEFLRHLTPEDPKAFAVRCKKDHQKKTNTERNIMEPDVPDAQAFAVLRSNE